MTRYRAKARASSARHRRPEVSRRVFFVVAFETRGTSRRARHDGRGGGVRRDRRRPRGSDRGAGAATTRGERYARSFDRSNPLEPPHPRPSLRADHHRRRRRASRVLSRPLVLTTLDPPRPHAPTYTRDRQSSSSRPARPSAAAWRSSMGSRPGPCSSGRSSCTAARTTCWCACSSD